MFCLLASPVLAQSGDWDGNPHNWPRERRCDRGSHYVPECGPCEGVGGIPSSDTEIKLAGCRVVSVKLSADTVQPLWPEVFNVSYFEVLIGQKKDPFCTVVFAGNSSAGPLCYRQQKGRQFYSAKVAKDPCMRMELDYSLNLLLGKVGLHSIVTHRGGNMTIATAWRRWSGAHFCTHVTPREGGHGAPIGPLRPDWTSVLSFVATEMLEVELVGWRVLNHFAWGPHHVWALPGSGIIMRMWQPYNGLEVFPGGLQPQAELPPSLFEPACVSA
jgi:hypothetical protein